MAYGSEITEAVGNSLQVELMSTLCWQGKSTPVVGGITPRRAQRGNFVMHTGIGNATHADKQQGLRQPATRRNVDPMDTLHHRLIGQQALVGPTLTYDSAYKIRAPMPVWIASCSLRPAGGATVPSVLEATPVVTSGSFAQ